MSLPKINYPLFDVVIPSTTQKVKMRPFLVKEEKLLLIAQTSGNPKDIVLTIKQVVNNCLVDKVDVDKLTTFDIEYLFVKLRAKSVNSIIDILYRDADDEEQYKVSVDLDQIEIKTHPDHTPNIKINESLGLVLRYPNTDVVNDLQAAATEVDLYFEIVKHCIAQIYDAEEVYDADDYSKEELQEFVSSLDIQTFKDIQKFLDTMPKLYYEASYTNKVGVEKKVVLQNLNDFFMLG